jgi:hypothetical protein
MAAEIQGEERAKRRPWKLVQMENVKPHTSKWNLATMEQLCFKRTVHLPFILDIAPSDFFFG